MKLNTILPPDERSVHFSLSFNFTAWGEKCEGVFAADDKNIYIYINGVLTNEYKITDFDELVCLRRAGTSAAQGITKDDEEICFCGFTQEMFLRFAEVLKLLEHYIHTGELITDTGEDEPVCPKCGMPLEGNAECVFCRSKTSVMVRLIKMIRPYRKYFIAAVICTLISQAIWVLVPYLDRLLIDRYVTPKNEDMHGIVVIAVSMISMLLIAGLSDFFNMRNSFKVALNLGKDIREAVFDKSQQLSMSSISKRTAGELISRISNDAAKIEEFVTANGKDAIVKLASFIIICTLMFIINWKLALLTLLPEPLVLVLVKKLERIMHVNYTRVWKTMIEHNEKLHDILHGIREVKSYGTEKQEAKRYSGYSEAFTKASIHGETMWYLTQPFAYFIVTAGTYFMLYFGGKMVLGETMSLGTMVQFTTYSAMLYEPIHWLFEMPRLLADASVSAGKVFEILDERSEIRDIKDPVHLDIKGDIEFKDVYFGYQSYDPVLKGINCNIKQGEMIGIVGHSGVGKSTLINLIMRLYDCTGGEIRIDGIPIGDIAQHSLRSQIGVVLQESFLFDGSVYDNIIYARPQASFEEVIRAAKIANAHEFITKLPDGYNTRVGNKGYQLSGGERQRIAIARAVINDPKIIILDEATASLDTQTEKMIQQSLGKLTQGRTTIAIAHRLSTLSNADRLFVLDQGKLAETGTHKELMERKGVYYRLVMAQRQTTKMKAAN